MPCIIPHFSYLHTHIQMYTHMELFGHCFSKILYHTYFLHLGFFSLWYISWQPFQLNRYSCNLLLLMATWCSMVLTDSKYIQSLFFFLGRCSIYFQVDCNYKNVLIKVMTCILIVASVSKMRLVKLNLILTGCHWITFSNICKN